MLSSSLISPLTVCPNTELHWFRLKERCKCKPRISCFFSGGNANKQEQARKALENALGGKKNEFEKWNKEIQKREEAGGGGDGVRGGWFGGRWWFGGSDGDRFWKETQQTTLTVAGIVFLYLIIAKGNVMFAIVFNSLLYVLRGSRNFFTSAADLLAGKSSALKPLSDRKASEQALTMPSAKERVVRKWGMN